MKFRIFYPFYYHAGRASLCVLFSCLKSRQETHPELHQTFEVDTAQTSGLGNLAFSYQTVYFFFQCEHLFMVNSWSQLSSLYQVNGY